MQREGERAHSFLFDCKCKQKVITSYKIRSTVDISNAIDFEEKLTRRRDKNFIASSNDQFNKD